MMGIVGQEGYPHGTEENLTEKVLDWIQLQIKSEEPVYILQCSQTSYRKVSARIIPLS